MAVNHINGSLSSLVHSGNKNAVVKTGSDNTQSVKPGASEELRISPQSQRLQQLETQLSTEPSIDTRKVEQLRAAIADGSYQVDSRQVAEKLAHFEKLLNG